MSYTPPKDTRSQRIPGGIDEIVSDISRGGLDEANVYRRRRWTPGYKVAEVKRTTPEIVASPKEESDQC